MKPISRTAFFTCGLRMNDAMDEKPVCSDSFAARFMNEEGLMILEKFRQNPEGNAPVLYRHRIMDGVIQDYITENPSGSVIILGAGFDSRAYRLSGGNWIEIDEPQVLTYKESCLPADSCPNRLMRIAVDFNQDSLKDKLASLSGLKDVLIVIEGVFVYLAPGEIEQLLRSLNGIFPEHKLLCDLLSVKYFNRYCLEWHKAFNDVGSSFKVISDRPEKIITGQGYSIRKSYPVIRQIINEGRYGRPVFLIRAMAAVVHRPALKGFHVVMFDSHPGLKNVN